MLRSCAVKVLLDNKMFYKKIYKMLDDVTPLIVDCGGLCNGACCKGGEEISGMYLFPGEKIMYKDMPEWAEICESNFTYDNGRRTELIVCNGTCERYLRPLSCRIFPLIPYAKRGEKLKIIMDIRAKGVCPLAKAMRLKDLNPLFVKRVTQAMNMCMKVRSIREYIYSLSESIDDILKVFKT